MALSAFQLQQIQANELARKKATQSADLRSTQTVTPTKQPLDLATTRTTRGAANTQAIASGTARTNLGVLTGAPEVKVTETKTETIKPEITSTPSTSASNEYISTLQNLGFGSGTLKEVQGLVNALPTKTAEDRKKKEQAQSALSALSSSGAIYFENPGTVQSAETLLDYNTLKSEQEAEYNKKKTELERQIENLNKIDESELRKQQKIAQAATSAEDVKFASSPEMVESATNPLIAQQFKTQVNEDLTNSRRRLENAQIQRAGLLDQLEKARNSGDDDLQAALSKQLAAVGDEIQKQKDASAKLAADANKEAWNMIDKVGIEAFAGSDAGTLSALFPQLDGAQLAGISYLAQQKQDLKLNDPDYLQKLANLEKTKREISFAGLTESQKDYFFWKQQAAIDPAGAAAFAKQKGFVPSESDLLDIQQKRANIQKTYDELGYAQPFSTNYTFQESATGVQWDVQPGTTLPRGECGEFVNDCIFGGPGYFGDSFSQKMTFANSDRPVVGGAFIMNTGDSIGHVGLVESIDYNSDGTIKGVFIRDSNAQRLLPDGTRVPPKTVDTSYFAVGDKSWNAIKGWFNPATYQGRSGKPGVKQYNDAQKTLMDSIDLDKVNTTTPKRLKAMGLNENDLYTYKAQNVTTATESQKVQVSETLDLINSLLEDAEGLSDAVGPISSKLPTLEGSTADYENRYNTLIAKMAIDNLSLLKGPMSDKDIQFIKQASSALNLGGSETGFKQELIKLRDKFEEKNNQFNRRTLNDPSEIQAVYDQLVKLQAEGFSDTELRSYLEKKGIDSSTFFN